MDGEAKVETISEQGKAPKTRIADAKSAYQLFLGIMDDDNTAAFYRAQIQGLIDGNPQYSAQTLKDMHQSWRTNVNFREAEAIIETNAASIWELDMEVPQLINVSLSSDDDEVIRDPGQDFAGIIEEEYTRAVTSWADYYFNRILCTHEMLCTGIGPMFWPDKFDWRPRVTKRAALLIPPEAKATSGELEIIGFRDSYQAHELFDKIKDEKSKELAEKAGWNVTLLREAIIRSSKNGNTTDQKYQTSMFETLQQQLKNNDMAASKTLCNPIRVINGLWKEFSGKITRVIIYEDEELSGYLYEGYEDFDSMDQVVDLFLWNIGDGYYKSVKGLGHRIYPHVLISNQFICSTVDSAMMSSSFVLKTQLGKGGQPQLVRIGPITVLPEGYDPVQTSFQPQLNQLVGVRTMLQQILNNNSGVYKKTQEGPELPDRTAREVTIDEMRSARLEKNQISIHYLYLDSMHREMFRRLVNNKYPEQAGGYKIAKRFIDRCVKRGVPRSLLNTERCYVTATRAVGYGSVIMRDMVTREALALSSHSAVDEIGKRNALRDRYAALVGHSMVDRYVPKTNRNQLPTSEHSIAALENNDLMNGQQVIVGIDQPHPIHWLIHLPRILEFAAAFMKNPQSINLAVAVPAMAAGLKHMSDHMMALSRDPERKEMVTQMKGQLDQLSQVFGMMQKTLAAQQQQQQQQAQEIQQRLVAAEQAVHDQQLQAKITEVVEKMRIREMDVSQRNALKAKTAEHKMALEDAETAANIRRKNAESELAKSNGNITPETPTPAQ